jgi:hypothetical protein
VRARRDRLAALRHPEPSRSPNAAEHEKPMLCAGVSLERVFA